MSWPIWIEELKRRYLADEASVFLLHGPGVTQQWPGPEGFEPCGALLERFLQSSRQILGRMQPGEKLGFHSPLDLTAFHRLVEARQSLDRRAGRNTQSDNEQVLGLLYLALTTSGPSQGYLVHGVEQLAPVRRKHLPELSDGAPALSEWASDPIIRGSNNVVVLLTTNADAVRQDLVQACAQIAVPQAPAMPEPSAPPATEPKTRARTWELESAEAEVERELAAASQLRPDDPVQQAASTAEVEQTLSAASQLRPDDPAQQAASAAEVQSELDTASSERPTPPPADQAPSLQEQLEAAFRSALLSVPVDQWQDNLPGRVALAQVLHQRSPERCGALSFELVDGKVAASGEGADWFMGWFRGDIAADAACGMVLKGLEPPEGGFTEDSLPALSPVGLRALSRRLEKLLQAG